MGRSEASGQSRSRAAAIQTQAAYVGSAGCCSGVEAHMRCGRIVADKVILSEARKTTRRLAHVSWLGIGIESSPRKRQHNVFEADANRSSSTWFSRMNNGMAH